VIEHEISWGKCVDVCPDGSRAVHCSGKKNVRVEARIQELVPSGYISRRDLHRQGLFTKTMRRDVKAVLDGGIETAKHIKFMPLNAKMFKLACQETGE